MATKISILILLVSVCSGLAKDLPYALDGEMCGQCRDILSKIKTHVLTEMESLAPEDRSTTICNLDDLDLQEQCYEMFDEHGDEFIEFIKNADETAICQAICRDLDTVGNEDNSLYFRSEMGATLSDEGQLNGFACSICKRFMTLIHNYLTNGRRKGFVIHILKGVCHFVPIFRTECELLVNMYGRMIVNLAARFLGPRLCSTFRLCPRHLPSSCADIYKWEEGHGVKNGTYALFNAKKEPFNVHCSFQGRSIYTYISTKTATNIDVSKLYNNKDHVLIRYQNKFGNQFESELSQIKSFKKTPLSVQYNVNVGYAAPQNKKMTPYLYLGFIPIAKSHKGAVQGYNANGKDYTFKNCDGNPNSYFTFLFNREGLQPVKYGPFDSALMHAWEKSAKPVPTNERIPCEYFSFYEIHFGGCGGYATTQQFPDVNGAALGLRYGINSYT